MNIVALRSKGYRAGIYSGMIITEQDAITIRQIDRLCLRIVCQNYENMVEFCGCDKSDVLLDMGLKVLDAIRITNYIEGDYTVIIKDGRKIEFTINALDQVLMGKYEQLRSKL